MRAVGFLAGVGSLLWEARDQGCDVVGNLDTRPYYKRAPWVWPLNFPEAPFFHTKEELFEARPRGWFNADLALGHPPCGKYSRLGNSGARVERFNTEERAAWHEKRRKDLGLVPLFIEMVNKFQPKTFALDNLPRMLTAISESEWDELLPGYRVHFITMVNWDYGSPQKRKRLWVVGTRGKKPFTFRPPEGRLEGPAGPLEAIRDLPWQPWIDLPEIDHVHHLIESKPIGGYWARNADGERFAIQDFIDYAYGFLKIPPGMLWPYMNNSGRLTHKPARARQKLESPCRTLSGNETLNHPLTGWPFTIRERARMMGWSDGFRFSDPDHPLDRKNITKCVMLTGRAIPSEFPRYLIPQLLDHASTA